MYTTALLPHQCIHAYLCVDETGFRVEPVLAKTPVPKRVFRKITIAYDKCNAGVTFCKPTDVYSTSEGRHRALSKLNNLRVANENNTDKYPVGAVAHSRFQPVQTRYLKVAINDFLSSHRERMTYPQQCEEIQK